MSLVQGCHSLEANADVGCLVIWTGWNFQNILGLCCNWGHEKVDSAFVVVPVEVDFDIFAASVIDRDIIMFFEDVDEVVGIVT